MQVAGHPLFRVLTLRSVPQIAPSAIKYTTFHWNAILRRLQQMILTATTCPDRLDWSAAAPENPAVARAARATRNRSAGSYLALRGSLAPQADAAALAAPSFFPPWLEAPLAVAATAAPFRRCEMSCALLSAERVRACQSTMTSALMQFAPVRDCTLCSQGCRMDVYVKHSRGDVQQSCTAPLSTAIRKSAAMLHAGAFVHQYERHGLARSELRDATYAAQEVVAAYEAL
jgi:hypothetical protein